MNSPQINKDEIIKRRLKSLSVSDNEYWSFKGDSNREYCHGIFPYPAMMVPKLVRVILQELCQIQPSIENIFDPFVGSGTVLTESIIQGKNFYGIDINPLAVLLCNVKSGPFQIEDLTYKTESLLKRIFKSKNVEDHIFFNIDKWFRNDIKKSLSNIRHCIKTENEKWARRFFWIAFSETIRLTSNSRSSTFKLHTLKTEDINSKINNVEILFSEIIKRNIKLYYSQANKLESENLLKSNKYTKTIDITLGDTRKTNPKDKCDLIITSPPYGDNTTTVPYGQYSHLPLQWIDPTDISSEINPRTLLNTNSIDSVSLGGSKKITTPEIEHMRDLSPSFSHYADKIQHEPWDRISRVSSFTRDFNNTIPAITDSLNPDGLMVWILGNRTVGGHEVPFDKILIELLEHKQAKHICTLTRSIPSKRMASKNNHSATMSKERIVVMRKN